MSTWRTIIRPIALKIEDDPGKPHYLFCTDLSFWLSALDDPRTAWLEIGDSRLKPKAPIR